MAFKRQIKLYKNKNVQSFWYISGHQCFSILPSLRSLRITACALFDSSMQKTTV